ncbi:MAG: hypothetical protein HFH65_11380 [Lachnospiraceae bacterium]|nr:hypothetical protein [Lachnospiraceae bacterium]
MKKKLFLSKAVNAGIGCMICALALVSLTGCHKKASPANTIEYSNIMGIAEGTADFKSTDSPEINIKDIKSYVGQEIDYSSGIDVKNVENFDDFQMWVDATGVDIYTAGRYTATYQFVFGEKTLEKTIGITILEREEVSGGLSAENQGNASGENNGSNQGSSGNNTGEAGESGNNQNGGNPSAENQGNAPDNNGDSSNPNQGPADGNNAGVPNGGSSDGNSVGIPNGGSNGNGSNGGSSGGNNAGGSNGGSSSGNNAGGSNGGSSSGNNAGGSNGGSSSGNNAGASTEHREIVTSSQSSTKKPSTIGYTNIELLSGKFVKLKCTSARYIVSTRTDESQTVKNDRTYQVSKLVITFNTGEERVLETVEKAVS